jgi:hypothetical protein
VGTEKDQVPQAETPATPEPEAPRQESLVDQYEFDTDPEPTPEPESPAPSPSAAPATSGTPVEAKAQPAPEEQPQPKKHPEALALLAADLGISQDEIDAATSDGLAMAIRHVMRANAQKTEPKAEAEAEPDIDLGLDESQYEPGLIGAMKKLARESAKEIKALKEELGQVRESEKARVSQENARRVDRVFESLGPDFESHFGKGPGLELAPESAELARRVSVLNFARQMKGDKPFDQKVKTAAGLLFPAAPKPTPPAADIEKILKDRQGEWQNGGVAKPTHRDTKELPKGPSKAKQTFMREAKAAGLVEDVTIQDFDESVE